MKKVISVAVAAALFGSSIASAHVPEAEWKAFKAEFSAMSDRVKALEAENARLRQQGQGLVKVEDLALTNAEVATLKEQSKSAAWTDKMKWKGDFRYRFENIDQNGKDERSRYRVRARTALVAKPGADTEVGIGLATGGADPVSTNQTLGGAGSTKDIRLDMAYFKWHATDELWLQAGKYKNSFYLPQKSGLIWDGDFRPEGVFAGWTHGMFFANAQYSFLESDSKKNQEDSWGVQLGAKFDLGAARLTAAAKYYTFPVKGSAALYDGSFFGNSTVDGRYANDYNIVNGSMDLSFAVADMPVILYADFVQNQDASNLDTGYITGIKLGKAHDIGSWQLGYQYQVLEADATLGLVSDSDFAGGGTDGEGHKFSAKYVVGKSWYVGATYFDTKRGVDLGSDADYKRLQVDTGFKF